MIKTILVEDIEVILSWKKVKNLNMRIKPPDGRVCLSLPLGLDEASARAFVESRLDWIRSHKNKMESQKPRPLLFEEGEDHYFLGRTYKLIVKEGPRNSLKVEGSSMELTLKYDNQDNRKELVEDYHRKELKRLVLGLVPGWENVLGVEVKELRIRKMKTRWGSCNTSEARIWLSLELAKLDPELIEYVLVHEMVHLLERGHNKRFYSLLDFYLPDWRLRKKKLG